MSFRQASTGLVGGTGRCSSFFFPLICLAGIFLGGCAMETYSPDAAPEYVVIRDLTGFYRLGPEQSRGADASLPVQTRVKLLRREMGYSLVQLEDTRTGYVPNENIAVAPPRIQSAPGKPDSDPRRNGGTGRKDRGQAYSGPQVNDTPLPNPGAPAPDLKIQPEAVPDTIPVPSDTPAAGPKFRY